MYTYLNNTTAGTKMEKRFPCFAVNFHTQITLARDTFSLFIKQRCALIFQEKRCIRRS